MKPIIVSEQGIKIALKEWFLQRDTPVDDILLHFQFENGQILDGVTIKATILRPDPDAAPTPDKQRK
jgi:hypothetical protein